MAHSLQSSLIAQSCVAPALAGSAANATPQKAQRVSLGVRASAESQELAKGGSNPGRREALLALSASATALVLPPVPLVGPAPALAADLTQRTQRAKFLDKLKRALAASVEVNQEMIPALLRLVLNDALTYDKESKTGGANGSIRFAEELERPENKGLEPALRLLESVKAGVDEGWEGGPLSYADLIVFGGSAALKRSFINYAVTKTGGDYKKGLELYRATGSAGNWGTFDKLFGRADAAGADPAGRIPDWETVTPAELKEKFAPFGIKPRQIVVLSVFFSADSDVFEDRLAADPEFATWVTKYQKSRRTTSQTDYQVDLIGAFAKLSALGAPINTEAYSYKSTVRLRF